MTETQTDLAKALELIADFDFEVAKSCKHGRISRGYTKSAKALLEALLGRKPTKEEVTELMDRLS